MGDVERWAREPDAEGTALSEDGVEIAWRVFGSGPTTVVLMPTWSVIHSRFWKGQVAHLARHHRVVTFDGRGCGRSGRPAGPASYGHDRFVADTVAVLEATGTEQAVLVGLSRGAAWSLGVAAEHPEKVLGLFLVGPSPGVGTREGWDSPVTDPHGWEKYNRDHWLSGGYRDFLDFFFGQMFPEPHSTQQVEDCVRWGLETSPEVLVDTVAAWGGRDGAVTADPADLCARVRCPVVVVHGTDDRVTRSEVGRRVAELTGGSLVLLEGSGHGPMSRDPVAVNHLLDDFLARVAPPPPAPERLRPSARHRPRRVLYLSSPIGLGHARRDLAIAQELRKLHPDVEVDWLAQHPVTAVLEQAGERVHPASRWLLSESAHVEGAADEHDLHAFDAIRSMDEVLVANFMVFDEVVRETPYDLVVGDEAWDVDHLLHENPSLKRFAFAWMTDFVGWLPVPGAGPQERRLVADHNAEMLEQRERLRWVRDRSVFVGDPADVVRDEFGPGLPSIRAWTDEHFDFAGYVTGFDPSGLLDRGALRADLGYREDERVCVVSVGGSGVGHHLLRRVLDAVPLVRRQAPDLRFVVVAGPRIDPRSLPRRRGARVVGHVPDLHRHLAASDLAVVQGGLTTCMELTATGRPFLRVPLRHHFEQQLHVRHRLDRYGAGRHVDYEEACEPDRLAELVLAEVGREVSYRPVAGDGAARAAGLLADLL